MSTNVSLRRSLRKIKDFRELSGEDLDAIINQMVFKEYKAGEVLWRTGTHLDFLGIIQKGEIVVERQINGKVLRSVKLFAGDVVHPHDFRGGNGHSSILARAVTDVRFYALRMDQKHKRQTQSIAQSPRSLLGARRVLLFVAWMLVISFVTVIVSWQDMSRVLAGWLYFESERANQPVDQQRSLELLNYAESVDRNAAFAHNQEGFLWYQRDELQNANSAFTRAVDIEQTNGPGLNNLAVTYFTFGQIQQAATSQEKATQNDPNSAVTHYNLGLILMKQDDYDEAVHEFREAIIIKPSWTLPYLQQSFGYLGLRDYANAEKAATTAINLDSNQQSAYVILAISLYNQNRNEEALMSIENALQIEPSDNVARFYKALILKKLDEFESALEILNQLRASTNVPMQISRINAEIEAIHRILQNRQVGEQ